MNNIVRIERSLDKPVAKEVKNINIEELSVELQVLIKLDLEQKSIRKEQEAIKAELEEIKKLLEKEKIGLIDNVNWRRDTAILISKLAIKVKGFGKISEVRRIIYGLLERRLKISFSRRIQNKKKSLALAGEKREKIDAIKEIDIIAGDKKLTKEFIKTVKEIAKNHSIYIEN